MKKDDYNDFTDLNESGYTKEPQGEPMSIRTRLVMGVAAAVLICVLGLTLPMLLNAISPAVPAETGLHTDDAPSVVTTAAHASTTGILAVTAYGAQWEETVLQPGEAFTLNEYSSAQSDVPGFPFVISVPKSNAGINADAIRIDVDTGSIITWEPPDYTVKERGKTYILSNGDTIYWSPLDKQGAAIRRCEMIVTGYTGNDEAYTQKIIIRQTEDFQYTAELSK